MQKSGLLPAETPAVLSQVAFRILIPCYLMSKVSTVLATQTTNINVAVVPIIAISQVLVGALVGKLTCAILYRGPNGRTKHQTKILAKKEALVMTACAFGNTLSLPLVFIRGILPPQDASLAAGYLALFIVGWSPLLWSIAYQILLSAGSHGSNETHSSKEKKFIDNIIKWYKLTFNPPLYGVLIGIIIGLSNPLSNILLLQNSGTTSTSFLSKFFHPIYDAAALLGSAAPAIQVTILACSLAGVMKTRSAKLPHFWGPKKVKSLAPGLAAIEHAPNSHESSLPLLEAKEVLAICCVRWLVLPALFAGTLSIAESMNLLTLDPICKITLLVLSAMPSAQNLVVLAQLRPSTRPLAKELANLLLFQYLGALLPITLWLALFITMVS